MSDLTFGLLSMKSIFSNYQMLWVFFFYGLGFLILAGAVFLKKRKVADISLTRSFYYLGFFGLIHGLCEWIDFSRLFLKINYNLQYIWLDNLKLIFLFASFILLLQFGVNLATIRYKKYQFFRYIPIIGALVFLGFTIYYGSFYSSEKLMRYLFGFSGAIVSMLAMIQIRGLAENKELGALKTSSSIMIFAFGLYAIFGGIITFTIAGIPPQLIRMICALLAGYASFSFLKVLEIGLGRKK